MINEDQYKNNFNFLIKLIPYIIDNNFSIPKIKIDDDKDIIYIWDLKELKDYFSFYINIDNFIVCKINKKYNKYKNFINDKLFFHLDDNGFLELIKLLDKLFNTEAINAI
jgi:hypothetical protein